MPKITQEMILKAKEAKSVEELKALVKEENIEMTDEQIKVCFEQMHSKTGELDENELENVTGGGCDKFWDVIERLGYFY